MYLPEPKGEFRLEIAKWLLRIHFLHFIQRQNLSEASLVSRPNAANVRKGTRTPPYGTSSASSTLICGPMGFSERDWAERDPNSSPSPTPSKFSHSALHHRWLAYPAAGYSEGNAPVGLLMLVLLRNTIWAYRIANVSAQLSEITKQDHTYIGYHHMLIENQIEPSHE